MLSEYVFKVQAKKLGAAFGISEGDKFEKRMEIYFENLQGLSDMQLTRAVGQIVKGGERFPSISALLEVGHGFSGLADGKRITECLPCDSTGYVTAKRKGERLASFRCPKCLQSPIGIPEWDAAIFVPQGYVAQFSMIDWDPNDEALVKGVLVSGEESLVWKKITEEMRNAALTFRDRNKIRKTFNQNESAIQKVISDITSDEDSFPPW